MTVTIENTNVDTVLNIAELTTASLTGTGVFDVLLQTLRLHLDREFTSGRITGTAYATVYSQAITSFLQQAVGFCLSKTKLALELQQLQEQITLIQKQQDQITAAIRQTDYVTNTQLPSQVSYQNKQTEVLNYELTNIKPAELASISADTALKGYELTDFKPIQKAQIQAETSHIGKQELGTIQQTRNLESQQAQIEATTDRLIYETTTKLPEEVQLIKLNQDQLIAQNNKIATDTVVTIKQGHLTDAQTCQVTAQTNQVNAEVALKLPEEVELVKRNQTMLTTQIAQVNAETTLKLPEEVEVLKKNQTQITAQIAEINYRTTTLMPSQTAQTTAQTAQVTYTTANLIPKQVLQLQSQIDMTDSQTGLYTQKTATELAQTTSTPAAGSVMGVQNALMAKQAENYDRDAEQKAAKLLIDTLNVRFTADSTSADFDYVNHLSDPDVGVVVSKLITGIGGTVAPPPPPTP